MLDVSKGKTPLPQCGEVGWRSMKVEKGIEVRHLVDIAMRPLTISKVVKNSTSSIDANGISAPTAPDIVV